MNGEKKKPDAKPDAGAMEVYAPIDRFSPERAEVLARLIEGLPKVVEGADRGFDMSLFAHPCGTPSCIAGWAASLLGRSAENASRFDLEKFLGCTSGQASWLTCGRFRPEKQWKDITPAEAAAAIRRMAAWIERGQDLSQFAKF